MRSAHPNLYFMYLTYALLSLALGLNFIFLKPAFMPLLTPKWAIGALFVFCGATKLALLLSGTGGDWLRRSMALSVAIMSFWAGALTFDFVRLAQTSMQLPLTYIGLAVLGFLLLIEPFINPAASSVPE